jgi:hypothetical protein
MSGGRRLLKALARERGVSLEKIAEDIARGDVAAAGVDGETLRKAAKRQKSLKKWRTRASAHDQSWDSMSKHDRKVFRAAWRCDRALAKLQKIVALQESNAQVNATSVGNGVVSVQKIYRDPRTGQPIPFKKATSGVSGGDPEMAAAEALDDGTSWGARKRANALYELGKARNAGRAGNSL